MPREKGWLASLISLLSASSQRSGLNLIGSQKFCESWVTVQALVYISVCGNTTSGYLLDADG